MLSHLKSALSSLLGNTPSGCDTGFTFKVDLITTPVQGTSDQYVLFFGVDNPRKFNNIQLQVAQNIASQYIKYVEFIGHSTTRAPNNMLVKRAELNTTFTMNPGARMPGLNVISSMSSTTLNPANAPLSRLGVAFYLNVPELTFSSLQQKDAMAANIASQVMASVQLKVVVETRPCMMYPNPVKVQGPGR
jgi:hypothetical protein